MARRAVGLGMPQTATQTAVCSLSVHPSEGGKVEKGMPMTGMETYWLLSGVALLWALRGVNWREWL